MPFGTHCISLICDGLREGKSDSPAEWWFSTSLGGAFGPERSSSASSVPLCFKGVFIDLPGLVFLGRKEVPQLPLFLCVSKVLF
jgi:hypothetical protein